MTRPSSLRPLAVILSCAAGLAAARLLAAPAASLRAILEVDRDAYYAADPVPVRVSIWNEGDAAAPSPSGEIPAGFELFDKEGKKLPSTLSSAGDAAKADAPSSGSRSLAPGTFYGYARDLTKLFPALREPGTYRLQWRSGDLASNPVILRVVPRYDPDKDYVARVETDMGTFTLDFLRKDAPIAVKTFVELAQTGFYDGVTFHYVEPGRVVAAGDPTGTGQGGPGFAVPHERPQIKMLAGTVILLPTGRPPTNGSMFAILLAPRPDYEGSATGFAQVTDGLEVVKKISEAPSTPREDAQPHKPLQPIRINHIVIRPKTA